MALMVHEPIYPIAWAEVEPKRISQDPDAHVRPMLLPVTAKGGLGARVIYPTTRKEEWLEAKQEGKTWRYLEKVDKSKKD